MATDLLTAADYYRLAAIYPRSKREFDDEARYITEGRRRRKEKMRLHIARERFADLKEESTRDAVIELRGVHGFTLKDCAAILDRPLHEIEFAWDIAKQDAR